MPMSWKMDPPTLGLSLLTINVGLAGMKSDAAGVPKDAQLRALSESLVLAAVAASISKSWWPLVFPVAYLGFDYAWSNRRGYAPQILAADDATESYSGN